MSARKKAPNGVAAKKRGVSRARRLICKTGISGEKTPNPAEKPHARVDLQKPVDAEIKRAAERAGIHASDVQLEIPPRLTPQQEAEQRTEDAAREKLVAGIARDLLLATEYLSEELASYEAIIGGGGDSSLVRSALHRVWQVRWNLGLYAGAQLPGGAS